MAGAPAPPPTPDPPAPTPEPAPSPTPPANPPEPKPDPPASNAAAAAERKRREAERERDAAVARLKEIEDAKKDDLTKEREKRETAERERDEARAEARKAETRSKVRMAAIGKVANPETVAALSEAKLDELAEATPEELATHVETTRDTYKLEAAASGSPAPGFGVPTGGGPSGAPAAPTPPAQPADPRRAEDPLKETRKGIGQSILGAAQRAGIVGPPEE